MYDTFIQFNQQIEAFQQFLTVIATVLEAYLGLIALSWLVSSILGATAVETQPQTEITPSEDIAAVQPAQELPVVLEIPTVETIPADNQPIELADRNVKELRQIAKNSGVKGYSRLSKSKLVAELQGTYLIGMVQA